MTRKEAIKAWDKWMEYGYSHSAMPNSMALVMAYLALRGPTREQVEALRGEWIKRDGYTECSKCEYWYPSGEVEEEDDRTPFCPRCGRPMTDEAVDIVMKRLEALKDGSTN